MRFFVFLLIFLTSLSTRAQDSPYARYATPVELLASGTASTNRAAWTSGATNAYDNYGMIYAYCSTCSDATNGARTVLLPPSGIGRWIATVKPPPGGWGAAGADGGGNVFTVGPNTQYAIPAFGAGDTNIISTGLTTDAGGTNLYVNGQLVLASERLTEPPGFSFGSVQGKEVIVTSNGKYGTINVSALDFDFTPVNRYYVLTNGSDAANGLTPATAKRTIPAVLSVAPAAALEINVGPGSYPSGLGSSTWSQSLRIVGTNSYIYQGLAGPSFSLDSSNTYTNAGATDRVVDWKYMDPYGAPVQLSVASSVANCRATPGTFIVNSGLIYIHCIDNRAPDHFVGTDGATTSSRLLSRGNLVLRGLRVLGSRQVTVLWQNLADDPDLFSSWYDVQLCGGSVSGANNDLVNWNYDAGFVINERVGATWSRSDGLNYEGDDLPSVGRAMEINCWTAWNGGISSADNGSTVHEGIKIIRMNGQHLKNYSRSIHDVGNGGSWNVCVTAGMSTSVTSNENVAFASGSPSGSDTTITGLYDCNTFSTTEDIHGWGASSVYVWRTPFVGKNFVFDDSSRAYYLPAPDNFPQVSVSGSFIGGSGIDGRAARFSGTTNITATSMAFSGDNVGIRNSAPAYPLDINFPDTSSREVVLKVGSTNSAGSMAFIGNAASSSGLMDPAFGGYAENNSSYAMYLWAAVPPTNDVTGNAFFRMQAVVATNPANPMQTGTITAPTNKPLWRIDVPSTNMLFMGPNGNIGLGGVTGPDAKMHIRGTVPFISDARDTTTNSFTVASQLRHSTGLSSAVGFGAGLEIQGTDGGATDSLTMARILSLWADPDAADRLAVLDFRVRGGSATDRRMTLDSTGTITNLGGIVSGTSGQFVTSSSGNLDKVNNVSLGSWPANSAGVFRNNGSGGLTWDNTVGTVTSFSSGPIGGVFSANVATATTTPALSFTAIDQNETAAFIWDNTANTFTNMLFGTGLTYTSATRTLTAAGSGGTVTSVSSGNIGGLFSVSVADPTTTPAFSFTATDPNVTALYGWDNTANTLTNFLIGSGLSYDSATHTLSATGGSGTVTSIGIALEGGSGDELYSVTGSPVTTSGNIAMGLNDQAQKTFFAGPTSGGDDSPTFRTITASDLGTGTGLLASAGAFRTITAGTGVSVADGDGSAGNPTITNTGLTQDGAFLTKTLVNSTPTDFITMNLPSDGNFGSVVIYWSATAVAGSDVQVASGVISFGAVNQTGGDCLSGQEIQFQGGNATTSGGIVAASVSTTNTSTGSTLAIQVDSTGIGSPTVTLRYKVINLSPATLTPL